MKVEACQQDRLISCVIGGTIRQKQNSLWLWVNYGTHSKSDARWDRKISIDWAFTQRCEISLMSRYLKGANCASVLMSSSDMRVLLCLMWSWQLFSVLFQLCIRLMWWVMQRESCPQWKLQHCTLPEYHLHISACLTCKLCSTPSIHSQRRLSRQHWQPKHQNKC